MLARTIKEKLRHGEPSIGTWMSMAHPSIAEILSMAGYDWVVIETEHTAIPAMADQLFAMVSREFVALSLPQDLPQFPLRLFVAVSGFLRRVDSVKGVRTKKCR